MAIAEDAAEQLGDEKIDGGRGHVRSIVLSNFKKFNACSLSFDPKLNVLVGDNEAGKSSILLALDLTLAGSRSKVEALGIDTLIGKAAVDAFLQGEKKAADLPIMFVEVYLSDRGDPDLHGRCNSRHESTFGLRFSCEPSEDYSEEIAQVLGQAGDNFPFEFYAIKFATFQGTPYGGYTRPVRHLLIDSSQISAEYAQREYTRALYRAHASPSDRGAHENKYRQAKQAFWGEHLNELNEKLGSTQFWLRSSAKSNMENDLVITEAGIPLDSRGRGQQSVIKIDFALSKGKGTDAIEALLLEEPENHLSHGNMRLLVDRLAAPGNKQIFIATHSSLICSRLDLRKAILLDSAANPATLARLDGPTADFFCKAPDNNVLEYAMSRRVLLVEGDAEFILIAALYKASTGSTLERDGVHVIAVGGTSFKRYLALANLLNIRTAVVRDNDGDYDRHCVANYEGLLADNSKVFADTNPERSTFEVCLYQDNAAKCDALFAGARRKLSVLEYMLDNKAEAALALLKEHDVALAVPAYLSAAMAWIRE